MSRQEWNYLWQLLKDIRKSSKGALSNVFVMVLAQALMVYIGVIGMGALLDGIYAGADMGTLVSYVLVILLGTLFCTVLSSRMTENFHRVRDLAKDLEAGDMNRKSLFMDYEHLEDVHVQELRSRVFAKSRFGVRGWFLLCFQWALHDLCSVVIAVLILLPMFFGSVRNSAGADFFLSSAGLCGAIVLLVWGNYKASMYYTAKADELYSKLGMNEQYNKERYFMEMLSGVESQKDLRINAQQERIDREMEQICQSLKAGRIKQTNYHLKREGIGMATANLLSFLVYAYTGICAYRGLISIGSVVVYAASIVELSRSATNLTHSLGKMKEISMIAKDYVEYMDLDNRKPAGSIPVEKRRDNRFSVTFEHVSFRYPGADRDVISDLTLSFEIGERMAIVGKNGSGKTTFIKLLCRLYDVTEGVIKVNGIDIRKYDYEEYCDLFSVVFQDFGMFGFSLGENIAASDQVDEARALDSLEKVGLMERFRELPEGLDTHIGKEYREEGVNFSGGERQKLAIARAIYKDAPFVIIDEPTAALDPLAECEVYEGFDKMVGNKTAIYISHRLASCRFCQDILFFDQGKVVQRGSHDELKGEEGLYRELWNAQAQYYVSV